MLSHDQMMGPSGYHGLRFHGSDILKDIAGAAGRGTFELCDGKACAWKGWVHPSGKMLKLCYILMAAFLDEQPNASAEELYLYMSHYPADGVRIPYSNGNMWHAEPAPWPTVPAAVRAAYEAYRLVYLQLWLIARTHHDAVAQALPLRPRPRLIEGGGTVVRLPAGEEAL